MKIEDVLPVETSGINLLSGFRGPGEHRFLGRRSPVFDFGYPSFDYGQFQSHCNKR